MDTMSSSEFRRRYANLVYATQVTVNGHLIGIWEPKFPELEASAAAFIATLPKPKRRFYVDDQALADEDVAVLIREALDARRAKAGK